MVKNKNQHIVPQHYLRGFSKDRDDKSIKNAEKRICRYNIKKPVKPYAAIKNTCIYSYFYVTKGGFDEVDKVIKLFEDAQAPILDDLINKQELPLNPNKMGVLYSFIMLLYTRTKVARVYVTDCPNYTVKGTVDPLEAQFINVMRPSILSSYALDELSKALLINESEKHFVTSDNPVIFCYCKINENGRITDAKCSGLMVFCPLTENLLLLFFDRDSYDVHMDTSTIIRVNKETDIDSINKLQLLKCYEEIYFHDMNELEYIKELYTNVKDHALNMGISYGIKLSFLKLKNENSV